jgi:hypothetical protein
MMTRLLRLCILDVDVERRTNYPERFQTQPCCVCRFQPTIRFCGS